MIEMIKKHLDKDYEISQLDSLARILLNENSDIDLLHYAIIGIRKLLLLSNNQEVIQQILDLNLVQKFMELMQLDSYPQLILETTWCCVNISYGTNLQLQRLIDKGLIPILDKLLRVDCVEIFEQAVWCVANIAADCNKFKNILIEQGVIQPIVDKLLKYNNALQNDTDLIKASIWALCNICRGKHLHLRVLQICAPAFIKVLHEQNDEEIISDALLGLTDICNEILINQIVDDGLVSRLREISNIRKYKILIPLFTIISQILKAEENLIEKVIYVGFIDIFYEVLLDNNYEADKVLIDRVKYEIIGCLSYTIAGRSNLSNNHIETALFTENRYNIILEHALNFSPQIKQKAILFLCNATRKASHKQIGFMVENRILE